MKESIERVWDNGLCTCCGTCAGICKNNAIEMRRTCESFKPVIDGTKCTECGACLRVCPGRSVEFSNLNHFVFGRDPDNVLLGNFINCYLGYSVDKKIRWYASSGGLVTSLLIYALEEGIIDGALVTRMSRKNAFEPEPFIARSKKEIFSACGSKYIPIPVNIMLKKIIEAKDKKFAVVGLPCHIHGIRKAEMVNQKLVERIVLHLGLFCGHTTNFLGTKFLLDNMGIQKENLAGLSYRGRGWPGWMSIKLKSGEEKFVPYEEYFTSFAFGFFTPIRCLLCYDMTAELADISFGDPWLPKLKNEKMGKSLVMSRTKMGEKMLNAAQRRGAIELSVISSNDAVRSNEGNLFIKKKALEARFRFFRLLGYKLPYYDIKPLRGGALAYGTLVHCVNACISNNLYSLLKRVPYAVLRTYAVGYSVISRTIKSIISKKHEFSFFNRMESSQ